MKNKSSVSPVAVIICTRNRHHEISGLLEVLKSLGTKPEIVIVVDSSESPTSELIQARVREIAGLNVEYVRALYGAPHQKNVGIEKLLEYEKSTGHSFEVVSFLDDDIIPGPDYFKNIISLFEENPEIFCIGGFDSSLPTLGFHRIRKFLGLTSDRIFVILPSGLTVAGKPVEPIVRCDWVPGGMQNFRRHVFDSHRFDGTVRIHGDEVEFQLRMEKRDFGRIAISSLLPVTHLAATSGKTSDRSSTFYLDGFRWKLAETYPERFSRFHVLLATFVLIVAEGVVSLGARSTVRFGRLLGHLDFLRALLAGIPLEEKVSHPGSGPRSEVGDS
jgi:GT2 family glycosyltransferase